VLVTRWEGALEVREPATIAPLPTPAHTSARGLAGLDIDPSR